MAIQNSIYLPSRMSRKKYFYDPLLEKGILNTSYSLGRDSSMDNEDYQDVCFCPSNNKLYALRTNSSTSVSKVDVICPNSTTKTCDSSCVGGPGATITIENGGGAIVYCPSVDRIFTISSQPAASPTPLQKLSEINPQDNTVKVTSVSTNLSADSVTSLIYNPMTDLIYASYNHGTVHFYSSTGGVESSWGNEILADYSEVTKMCVDPERNRIHLFDGSVYRNQTSSNYCDVQVDKNNTVSYTHVIHALGDQWLDPSHKVKDVIYCPYDSATYWLSSESSQFETRILRLSGTFPSERSKVIKINELDGYGQNSGGYERLIYCPDNNMIYVLSNGGTMHMINPADEYGTRPMVEFYNPSVSMKTNGVCYSPVNNRIYGVGNDGYITYIDPTT